MAPTIDPIAAIQDRLAQLQRRIDQAALRSGRRGSDISVLGVTKFQPAALARSAYAAGLRDFGENYVQEALDKQNELADLPDARWHFIGHLQSNKTNAVAGRFTLIHSVDSLKLGQRIGRAAQILGQVQSVLVQVKLGGEATKSGVSPESVLDLCGELAFVDGIRLRGLMAIAPLAEDGFLVKEPRAFFAQAKALFEMLPSPHREILSMGMSADFETAIEEGATLIRVGTTLFGKRDNANPASPG